MVWTAAWSLLLMTVTSAALQELSALLPPIFNSKLDDLVRAASDTCEALPLDILFSRQYISESPQLDIVEFSHSGQRTYRVAKAHLKLRALNISQLVLYVPGWWNTPVDESSQTVVKALLTKHPVILVLDTRLAFCRGYVSSASRVRSLAQSLYTFLQKLHQVGSLLSSVHLVGFSLGAHVVGIAGKMVRNKLHTSIGQITALDPARPCFSRTKYRLAVNDAEFVQVIHSSAGVIGIEEPAGDLDVYINGIGTQPECRNATVSLQCDHSQAWKTYSMSVLNETAFTGRRCLDWAQLVEQKCSGEEAVIGYGASPKLKGIFLYKNANITDQDNQLKVFNIFDFKTWW